MVRRRFKSGFGAMARLFEVERDRSDERFESVVVEFDGFQFLEELGHGVSGVRDSGSPAVPDGVYVDVGEPRVKFECVERGDSITSIGNERNEEVDAVSGEAGVVG